MDSRRTKKPVFPETKWTLILQAAAENDTARQRALSELCELYWPPIYAFIRTRGYSPHDAEDLTQDFFARFLSRGDFEKLHPERGRLRSYLLGAVKNHLASEHRHARRQKRGGDLPRVSLDLAKAELRCLRVDGEDASHRQDPERLFQKQWAITVMENALWRLETRYAKEGKAALFAEAKILIMPTTTETVRRGEIAERLGMSEAAFRVAVHRLRQRYRHALRETVAVTLAENEDLDEELRELRASFS